MKEVTSMRSIMISILLVGIIWVGAYSCTTVPKEPLASSEVRLLSMEVLGAGVEANSSFAVNIFFEAAGNPEIKRACFYESGEEPSCFEVSDASYVTLGTKKAFQVYLPGLNIDNGEAQSNNVLRYLFSYRPVSPSTLSNLAALI
jgi:hypothetical protein